MLQTTLGPRTTPPKPRHAGQSFSRGQGHGPVFPPPPADYERRSDVEPPSPIVISREECVVLFPLPPCPHAVRAGRRCSPPRPLPRPVKFMPSRCRLAQYRDLPRSASRADITSPHPFAPRTSRCPLPLCVTSTNERAPSCMPVYCSETCRVVACFSRFVFAALLPHRPRPTVMTDSLAASPRKGIAAAAHRSASYSRSLLPPF